MFRLFMQEMLTQKIALNSGTVGKSLWNREQGFVLNCWLKPGRFQLLTGRHDVH